MRGTANTLPPLPPLPPNAPLFWSLLDAAPQKRGAAPPLAIEVGQTEHAARPDAPKPPGCQDHASVSTAAIPAPPNQDNNDWNEVGPLDGFEPAPQSIPDARMIAGLLAASRVPATMGGRIDAAGPGLTVYSRHSEAGALTLGSVPVVTVSDIYADDGDLRPAPQSGQLGHSTSTAADPWAAGIAQLQGMPAPASFTPAHWQAIQRSCAILQDRWGPELRRLGWSTVDAFGVHPTVGAAGLHSFGLGPLLGDAQVVDLTETRATIVTAGGVRQSYTRRAMPWAVPVWEVSDTGKVSCKLRNGIGMDASRIYNGISRAG